MRRIRRLTAAATGFGAGISGFEGVFIIGNLWIDEISPPRYRGGYEGWWSLKGLGEDLALRLLFVERMKRPRKKVMVWVFLSAVLVVVGLMTLNHYRLTQQD